MSKKKKEKRASSAVAFYLGSDEAYQNLVVEGYSTLDKNPEIMTGVKTIAEIISGITIHLMANSDNGDVRIINELSRKIDINPSEYMTRRAWMESLVTNLLLYGNGNSVVRPHTTNGLLGELEIIAPYRVSFDSTGIGYQINIDSVPYNPADLLHFRINPDQNFPWKGTGLRVQLKDVANNLKQEQATVNGYLGSKWKPSIIIKVDAMTEEFANKTGREKLLKEYFESSEAGQPWLIPAENFSVEQVRPLTLADLAIRDNIELDKRTVAAILGVPPFVLGVGEYSEKAWNHFIQTKVANICTEIAQEMTRKLILSPKWYLKFNIQSLYDWDIETTSSVFCQLGDRGYVTGNEVRDRLGMSPKDGLDELRILENYIPADMSGNQKKLNQEE